MSDLPLGQIIKGDHKRDAIHVAVAPVFALVRLYPGQDIGFMKGSTTHVCASANPFGIVDPFLKQPVNPEEQFFAWLYPNTVTGMRHEWQHPLFGVAADDSRSDDQKTSEQWLREQCSPLGVDFEDLVSEHSQLVNGDYIMSHLNEDARDHWYEIVEEFWRHHEIYTGRKTEDRNRGGFTCSC